MTTRRGFLGAVLALAAAPAIVRAGSLMPIYVPKPQLLTLWGDNLHDDTEALQAYIDGQMVAFKGGTLQAVRRIATLPAGATFLISRELQMPSNSGLIGNGSTIQAQLEMDTGISIADARGVSLSDIRLDGFGVRVPNFVEEVRWGEARITGVSPHGMYYEYPASLTLPYERGLISPVSPIQPVAGVTGRKPSPLLCASQFLQE